MGSVLTLPTTGALINRWGAGAVVRAVRPRRRCSGSAAPAIGAGVLASVPVTAVGLFFYGVGIGSGTSR